MQKVISNGIFKIYYRLAPGKPLKEGYCVAPSALEAITKFQKLYGPGLFIEGEPEVLLSPIIANL